MGPARIRAIQDGSDQSLLGTWARRLFDLLEPLYSAGINRYNADFDSGARPIVDLGRPTLSVGNITTGGTGKTPMVIRLAEDLLAMGSKPAILLRGYQGKQRLISDVDGRSKRRRVVSDEADLYAECFGGRVPVAADPDRTRGARTLLERHPNVGVLVLDDAFQHRQVQRDVDLVLVDATQPLMAGRLLPRGMLREPAANLSRATAVIITRADQASPAQLEQIEQEVITLHGRPALATAGHGWDHFRDAAGRKRAIAALGSRKVVGVCGIGNPDAFFAQLAQRSLAVEQTITLADHHPYSAREVARYVALAREHRAVLVTTAKDWMKWRHLDVPEEAEIWVPQVRIQFLSGETNVKRMLEGLRWNRMG